MSQNDHPLFIKNLSHLFHSLTNNLDSTDRGIYRSLIFSSIHMNKHTRIGNQFRILLLLVFKHVLNPRQGPGMGSPFSIVTALVDQIDFSGKILSNSDIKISGYPSCATPVSPTFSASPDFKFPKLDRFPGQPIVSPYFFSFTPHSTAKIKCCTKKFQAETIGTIPVLGTWYFIQRKLKKITIHCDDDENAFST